MRRVSKALQRQLKLNEGKNLLHDKVEQILEIDTTFLAALEELVGAPRGDLSAEKHQGLAAEAAASLIARVYILNQYIQIDEGDRNELKQIYLESWQRIADSKQIEATIRGYHYPQIKAFLKRLYPKSLAEGLRFATNIGRVPSSEYSAALQMKLLRLELGAIREPLLDIGCGTEAHLVRYLRSYKVDAYGFDRSLEEKTDYLGRNDWFSYPYGTARWGTVVSHLSFANHCLYVQKYESTKVSSYLGVFSQVLYSLKKNGSFVFSPAVELFEKQADRGRYRIEKWDTSSVAQGMRITRLAL